ncbi:hypothetical protein F8280_16700 [Micromonospora noduli]|uniref:hypothetical protein n=1 Tax=Micromonospora noduli TaxID=709876 RepID=UPI00124B5B69|nr:hypothetical protein [Micromonospora noduli]KAB1923146.1 hypothetical protein F8280_16700 [Micromonospora noduli]
MTFNRPTQGAQAETANAINEYANRLVRETEKQELSKQPPGVLFPEIAGSSVVRAKESMNKHGTRAKPHPLEAIATAGVAIFAASTGVFGSYLNSPWQVACFVGSAFLGTTCVLYTIVRRYQ